MQLDEEQQRALAKLLRGPDERLDPPLVAMQAAGSALGGHAVVESVVEKIDHRIEGEPPATTWRFVALIEGALVVVELKNEVADWELGTHRSDPEPSIDARVIPLRELIFCRVDGIEPIRPGLSEWSASWVIGIRGSEPIVLRDAADAAAREAASKLARAIVDRLIARN